MKTTRYCDEQVMRKRPSIRPDWCGEVLASPVRRDIQKDGRLRFWGKVLVPGDGKHRFLRVITLADGETVHNAFFDRDFRDDAS